jgi:hypothetical protein
MSQVLAVAAELQISDILANGPKRVDDLARITACDPSALHRLLRALTSLGLCTQGPDDSFSAAPLGSLLQTQCSHSLRNWAIWWGKYQWHVWSNLQHSVRTGESARKLITGSDDFAHLPNDAEAARVFNHAMAEFTALVAAEVLALYDFGGVQSIVDVGGGHGAMLAPILSRYPACRGIILDLAHAQTGARHTIKAAGLESRCEFESGDFFKSVPRGAHTYMLKAILHDWDDEQCRAILRNCRKAISETGKLLIIERVLPDHIEPCSQHLALARADLNMLVALGGRERTEREFEGLLRRSSFKLVTVISTELEYSILEAVPA